MIRCGAMMLEFLSEKPAADLIVRAIRAVTAEGRVLTPDLGGSARTREVTNAIVAHARQLSARS
jgi:tartrate dehydrogenase/decarboxylase/D-malate dehydrogenase